MKWVNLVRSILGTWIEDFHHGSAWGEVLRSLCYFNQNILQLTFTCSNSTIETPEKGVKYVQNQQWKHQNNVNWRRSRISIVNFEHISRLFLVFLLLTSSILMLAGGLIGICLFKVSDGNIRTLWER